MRKDFGIYSFSLPKLYFIVPLIGTLEIWILTHIWYADENDVVGSLELLRIVLDKLLNKLGGALAYYVIKCNVITKSELVQKANKFILGLICLETIVFCV